MAQRRMFSKNIIESARFLRMPISSQALYFHLGIKADDDGVVEAYTVLRMTGATEDDLRILSAKGLIIVLNDDLVSFITDWTEHNKIRADRKIDSIYKDLLVMVLPDVELIEKKQRADIKQVDNQWTTNGQPMDGIGKGRLGKGRLGKDIEIEEVDTLSSPSKPKPAKHKYGEYKNVLLTDDHIDSLKTLYPDYEKKIENLSEYIEVSGKKYKNHYATIKSWARKDEQKSQKKTSNKNKIDELWG